MRVGCAPPWEPESHQPLGYAPAWAKAWLLENLSWPGRLGLTLAWNLRRAGAGTRRGSRTPAFTRAARMSDTPKLVIVDVLRLPAAIDTFLSLTALASYAGLSVRWFMDTLTDPHPPLACYRLPGSGGRVGKIVVRPSEFDTWIARYRQVGNP